MEKLINKKNINCCKVLNSIKEQMGLNMSEDFEKNKPIEQMFDFYKVILKQWRNRNDKCSNCLQFSEKFLVSTTVELEFDFIKQSSKESKKINTRWYDKH